MSKERKILVVSFQSLTATSGQGMARLGHALSKELHKRGLLKTFVIHSKGKFNTPFPSEPVSFFSRYYLFVLNKINKLFKFETHGFRFLQERLFDLFCSLKLNSSVGVIFSTHPHLKKTFKKAQQLNIRTILLSGTPEDNYMFKLVSDENEMMGNTEIDAYTYKDRNQYFNDAMQSLDVAIGFFPTVYDTFKSSPSFKGTTVKMTGHMTPDFSHYDVNNKKPIGDKFVVGFLSYTVVLKGLHYLLQAWDKITTEHNLPDIELIVGGPMNPTIAAFVKKHFSNVKQVSYAGHISDVAGFMQQLDLFVVPSILEGGPMSAIEAAHYGIPVLITRNAGSYELIERGEGGGYIVPIRDPDAIADNILWAYNNKEQNAQKGLNAKQNLSDYSFGNFIEGLADYLQGELNGK